MKTFSKRSANTVYVASARVAGFTSGAKAMFVFAFLAACEGKRHEFGPAAVNGDASAVVMGLDPVSGGPGTSGSSGAGAAATSSEGVPFGAGDGSNPSRSSCHDAGDCSAACAECSGSLVLGELCSAATDCASGCAPQPSTRLPAAAIEPAAA
jgi:hypothetical protein